MMVRWNPTFGEFFKSRLEPKNEYNKFPVAVIQCNAVVRHLSKGKTGRFAKTISFFLQTMKVLVTGKRGTLTMEKDSGYPVNTTLLEMQNTLAS